VDRHSQKSNLHPEINEDLLLKKSAEYQKNIDKDIIKKIPEYNFLYDWSTKGNLMIVQKEKTRAGFGQAIAKKALENKKIVALGADISGSINLSDFYTKNKHLSEEDMTKLKERFISLGISEQSIAGVAAGLAKEGFFPVFGTYGVFSAGRASDQLRMFAYDDANVLVLGAHAGVSVGPDGATHQALEDLSAMLALPNMNIEVPSDFIETRKAGEYLLTAEIGSKYLRYARESTPIITREDTPYEIGKANIIKYRGEQENFIDAFEIVLAENYNKDNAEKDDVSIITCGPITAEAMRAAWILKETENLNARVVNIHTVKHYVINEKGERELKILDEEAVINAAKETGIVVTAEEHQTINGFGTVVASQILESGYSPKFAKIGIQNKFGQSGSPDELAIEYELRAENIVKKVMELYIK
jgi:transketolase